MPQYDVRPTVVFRPTVVIGLGGTGYGVVLKLKKHFVDTYGAVPPIIQLLSIDTTENAQQREETNDGLSVTLDSSEFYPISVTNPGQVVRINPHIQEWWPSEVNANLCIDKGAGQVRARGRLGLFARSAEISDRIHSCINQVRDLKSTKEADAQDFLISSTGGVEVFIVGSLAGGTGSGTFLDVAFMTRDRDPLINITGILALPRVFMGKPFTELVQSNAYGALKEIESFWHPEPFDINYGHKVIEVTRSPFDLLFLIDSLNEMGKVVNNPMDLQSLIADGLYVQIASQIGVDSNNAADNMKTMVSENLVKKRRVSYCSFGVASLTLPVQQYQQMQLEDAQKLINSHLLGMGAGLPNVAKEVDDFIQTQQLSESDLLDNLSEKSGGGQLRFQMPLAGFPFNQDASRRIKEDHTRYYDLTEQRVAQTLAINYAQIEATLLDAIHQWWEKSLNWENGIESAQKILKDLQKKIQQLKEDLQKKSQDAQRQFEAIRFEARESKISDVANAFNPFNRERKIQAACESYAGLVNQQCQMYLHWKRCDKAVELLSAINNYIEDILSKQQQITSNLKKCVTQFSSQLRNVTNTNQSDNPFEQQLQRFDVMANRPQVSYEEFVRWRREKNRSLSHWATMRSEEIEAEIREFIEDCYRPLTAMSIDQVIRNSDPEAIAEDLRMLWNLACPLWRYDSGKIPTKSSSIINEAAYYGVQDAGRTALTDPELASRLPKGRTDPSFVSTSDPHKITVFRAKVGVPLFALHDIETMEQAYKDPGKAFKHLHKDWEFLPDLIPTEDSEAMTWFALGLALKIIYRRGRFYYVVSPQSGRLSDSTEIQLSKGRIESFQKFNSRKNRELVSDVAKLIEEKIEHIREGGGDSQVISHLTEYIDKLAEQLKKNPDIDLNLKKQVKSEISVIEEYIQELDDPLLV
ncbi:MAG: tubulin-like doman-containing protein [Halothece sp.]